ncbi:Uma2 family endonuclease [Alienimonas sp. DA493]|uniref:Uma2 family endonuclease n=1 Tax=Alienimonas sp. DA493 TaxID=3373605 RepID=UPI0037553243
MTTTLAPPKPVPPADAAVAPTAERQTAEPMTEEEYLAFERAAPVDDGRHEFAAGKLIKMSGASRLHNSIAGRIYRILAELAESAGMEAYMNDLRLRVPGGRFRYPDVMVAPEPPEMLPGEEQDTLLNPVVLVEVLSPSTATVDQVDKQAEYREIPSLTDYLILSQDEPRCDHYSRLGGEAWKLVTLVGPEAVLSLSGLGDVSLGSLYPPAA